MANPQIDNGYTKIANEIMEALAKIRIAGEARQMLDVIIRKTYGFNKTSDRIATSQFMEFTNLSHRAIYKARRKLKQLNIITISQKGDSQYLTYSFQKDYNKWKLSPKKETVAKKDTSCLQKRRGVSPKKGKNCLPKGDTQKKERNYTKETIQNKEIFPFSQDKDFTEAFNDYLEMRKANNKKATDKAKELVLKKLHKHDIKTAIAMLEQSTMNSYQGVFPVKPSNPQQYPEIDKDLSKYDNIKETIL